MALVNAITIGVGAFILYSTLLPVNLHKNFFLTALLSTRTILDYIIVWDFYYPKESITK